MLYYSNCNPQSRTLQNDLEVPVVEPLTDLRQSYAARQVIFRLTGGDQASTITVTDLRDAVEYELEQRKVNRDDEPRLVFRGIDEVDLKHARDYFVRQLQLEQPLKEEAARKLAAETRAREFAAKKRQELRTNIAICAVVLVGMSLLIIFTSR